MKHLISYKKLSILCAVFSLALTMTFFYLWPDLWSDHVNKNNITLLVFNLMYALPFLLNISKGVLGKIIDAMSIISAFIIFGVFFLLSLVLRVDLCFGSICEYRSIFIEMIVLFFATFFYSSSIVLHLVKGKFAKFGVIAIIIVYLIIFSQTVYKNYQIFFLNGK